MGYLGTAPSVGAAPFIIPEEPRVPENPVPATGLRAALRNSLLGWGATGWVSPRRQRTAKLVFPVAGFAMGILVARIYRVLPDEVETRELALLMAGVV